MANGPNLDVTKASELVFLLYILYYYARLDHLSFIINDSVLPLYRSIDQIKK